MAEISILNPTVLNGLVEKFTAPETYVGLTQLFSRTEPSLDPTAKWDVIEGNREIAAPNIPNSEAHIVPHLGVGERTASFIYLREKKVFKPTTIRWLRTPGELSAKNAERAVLREVRDLDRRFDAFAEWCIWQALSGGIVLNYPDVKANVDYGFSSTHKPSVTKSWASNTKTVAELLVDINTWKRLIALDGRVQATDVWLCGETFDLVIAILATSDRPILSDRMRDELMATGTVNGLFGLTWHIYDLGYVDSAGQEQRYIPVNAVVITSSANNAFYLMEGPSADEDAPQNHVGKYVKTWKEPDPSARQHLEEWSFLPIIERPEQIVYVTDVTDV